MTKIVIAGSRYFEDYKIIREYVLDCLKQENVSTPICILSGGCRGADTCGERFAKEMGFQLKLFPAEWNKYKRAAGPIRNKVMVQEADVIICFWDKKSKGTKSLIDFAIKEGKKVYIKTIESQEQKAISTSCVMKPSAR